MTGKPLWVQTGVDFSGEVFVERRRSEGSPEKTGKMSLVPEDELFHDGLQVLSWQERRGRERTRNSEQSQGGRPAAASGGREVQVTQTRVDGDWEHERNTEGFWRCGRKAGLVGRQLGNFLKVKSVSRIRLFAIPWTVAHQASPSIEFSRQEYWSGLPFPSPSHTQS